jgi:hypothetical protein
LDFEKRGGERERKIGGEGEGGWDGMGWDGKMEGEEGRGRGDREREVGR